MGLVCLPTFTNPHCLPAFHTTLLPPEGRAGTGRVLPSGYCSPSTPCLGWLPACLDNTCLSLPLTGCGRQTYPCAVPACLPGGSVNSHVGSLYLACSQTPPTAMRLPIHRLPFFLTTYRAACRPAILFLPRLLYLTSFFNCLPGVLTNYPSPSANIFLPASKTRFVAGVGQVGSRRCNTLPPAC